MFLETIGGEYINNDNVCRYYINSSQDIYCELRSGTRVCIYAAPLTGERDKRISYPMYMEACLDKLIMSINNRIGSGTVACIINMDNIVSSISVYDYIR